MRSRPVTVRVRSEITRESSTLSMVPIIVETWVSEPYHCEMVIGSPAAQLGSEVTLWGQGPGGSLLGIDEIARAAGTIGYELMCALAPRVPVTVA